MYFVYQVVAANANQFTSQAAGDVDGDTTYSCWSYAKSNNSGTCVTPTLTVACGGTGSCDQVLMNGGYSAKGDDIY
jgi:hypothetical protein